MENSNIELDWKKAFKKFLIDKNVVTEDANSSVPESIGASIIADDHEPEEKYTSDSKSFCCSNNIAHDYSDRLHSTQNITDAPAKSQNAISKQTSIFSDLDRKISAPQWNITFKRILGDNLSAEKNESFHHTSGKNIKEDKEERKVRELFAKSGQFKHIYPKHINEYEGAGVDIFKGKKGNEFSSNDFNESECILESDVLVTGFVAKYKPYTTADIAASPVIPFLEDPWDDDLLI